MSADQKTIDHIAAPIIKFLSGLHNCYMCEYMQRQITGKGKERTGCAKYHAHISRVRDWCIDRFPGFSTDDMKEIARQYKNGDCEIVLNGVAV